MNRWSFSCLPLLAVGLFLMETQPAWGQVRQICANHDQKSSACTLPFSGGGEAERGTAVTINASGTRLHWYRIPVEQMGKLSIEIRAAKTVPSFGRLLRGWVIRGSDDSTVRELQVMRDVFRVSFRGLTPDTYYIKFGFRNSRDGQKDIRYNLSVKYEPITIRALECDGAGRSESNPCNLGSYPQGADAPLNVTKEGHLTAWEERDNWFDFTLRQRSTVAIEVRGGGDYPSLYYRAKLINVKSGDEFDLIATNNVFGFRRTLPPGRYLLHYKLNWNTTTANHPYTLAVRLSGP